MSPNTFKILRDELYPAVAQVLQRARESRLERSRTGPDHAPATWTEEIDHPALDRREEA